MALVNFSTIKELISGKDAGEDIEVLFKEVLLLVLARATRVDSNVEAIEVHHIQKAMKDVTGAEFSEGDIRTAAASEIYETQSLARTLSNATRKLGSHQRLSILACLAGLIRIDSSIRYQELEFFDHVATSLKASPSEIAGLAEG